MLENFLKKFGNCKQCLQVIAKGLEKNIKIHPLNPPSYPFVRPGALPDPTPRMPPTTPPLVPPTTPAPWARVEENVCMYNVHMFWAVLE